MAALHLNRTDDSVGQRWIRHWDDWLAWWLIEVAQLISILVVRSKIDTMYGEDSSGRKVSLLNDESSKNSPRPRLLAHSHRTRSSISSSMSREDYTSSASSISVSPGISPATPQLSHIDSLPSLETHSTPSPMTPSYPFDPLDQSKNPTPYYAYHRPPLNNHNYPAMPQQHDVSSQPYYHLPAHRMNPELDMENIYSHGRNALQPLQTRLPYANSEPPLISPPTSLPTPSIPHSASSTPATSTPTSSTSKPVKKKYPCPHATRYSCHDTFTTSGHAARHGKKHTGEKNILCPTCHKAFTRKDNMKQHERTHKSTRHEASSPPATAKKVPPSSSNSRRRLVQHQSRSSSETPLDQAPMDLDSSHNKHEFQGSHQVDLSLRTSRPPMQRSEASDAAVSGRMGSMGSRSEEDGEGESPGLDALATAATELGDA